MLLLLFFLLASPHWIRELPFLQSSKRGALKYHDFVLFFLHHVQSTPKSCPIHLWHIIFLHPLFSIPSAIFIKTYSISLKDYFIASEPVSQALVPLLLTLTLPPMLSSIAFHHCQVKSKLLNVALTVFSYLSLVFPALFYVMQVSLYISGTTNCTSVQACPILFPPHLFSCHCFHYHFFLPSLSFPN